MSNIQDAFARGAFSGWLEETIPAICEEGNLIVWKGYAYGDVFNYTWYRVAIKHYADCNEIEVDCQNASMKDWMLRNKSYIKGKLIWYCRAVWDLMKVGLLDGCDFDRTEEQAFADEEEELEPWDRDEREAAYWAERKEEEREDIAMIRAMERGNND